MPVQPAQVRGAGDEKADDGAEPEDVKTPRGAPPGEVRLSVAVKEEPAQRGERSRDGGLEEGSRELGIVGERNRDVHGSNKGLAIGGRNGALEGGVPEGCGGARVAVPATTILNQTGYGCVR
jgi:hypothetical protein